MWAPKYRDTWLNIFDSPNDYFYIKDCIVDFQTGLIYKDGQIFWEASNENIIWHKSWISIDSRWKNRIYRYELILERMREITSYFESKLNKDSIKKVDEGVVLHLLHPFNRYVYVHIFDTFQKLQVVNKYNLIFDSVLLAKSWEINDFDEHLKALKLNEKTIIDSDSGLVEVKNLIFIKPVGHPTSFTEDSYRYIRDLYFSYFNIDRNIAPSKKLFLTRRPGVHKRSLLNDAEVEFALKKKGVQYLDGSESFPEALKLFASASHISGVHGAQFMNNIFAHETAIFREFCPRNRNVRTFYDQFKLCGDYQHILVDCDSKFNINIDVEELLNFYDL